MAAATSSPASQVLQLAPSDPLETPADPETAPSADQVEECVVLLSRYLEASGGDDSADPGPGQEPEPQQLRDEIAHHEARIQVLISELETERSALDDARATLAKKERELSQRGRMYREIKARFEKQSSDLATALERTDQLWVTLCELKEESHQLREVICSQEEDLEDRSHAAQVLEETTRLLRRNKTELRQELTRTRVELSEARRELDDNNSRLRAMEEENAALNKRVSAYLTEPDSAARLERLAEELTRARVELRTTELERDNLRQNYEQALAIARAAQERIAHLEVEMLAR